MTIHDVIDQQMQEADYNAERRDAWLDEQDDPPAFCEQCEVEIAAAELVLCDDCQQCKDCGDEAVIPGERLCLQCAADSAVADDAWGERG